MEFLGIRVDEPMWDQVTDYVGHCEWDVAPILWQRMRARLFDEWERVFVALDDGAIVGYCAFSQVDYIEDTGYGPFIGYVWVEPRCRGHRVSQQMIEVVLGYARGLGFGCVYVLSGHEGLYEKYGFVLVDKLPLPDGELEQVFVIGTEGGELGQVVTVPQMRDAEAAAIAAVGDDAVMQRAAAGLADIVARELAARCGCVEGCRVLVLAGPGNNGGDGLFAGTRLARQGARVTACRTAGQVHQRGWDALLAAGGEEASLDDARASLGDFDLVIDAIFGIGGKPGLRPPLDAVADELIAAAVPVVACDLPSGMSADPPFGLAEGLPCLRADVTVTFGARKLCQVTQPAMAVCGRVDLVDIGLWPGGAG